jgi:hypothetical protein
MKSELLTVDDFYNNPEQVRNAALGSDFSVRGNFPGQRTASYLSEPIKQALQALIFPHAGRVTDWGSDYTGAFQYTTKNDTSWVHSDHFNNWACIVYLTPKAPHSAGTGLFRHKETGLIRKPKDVELEKKICAEGNDLSKWEMTDVVSNRYNRLVMFRGDLYHRSLDYFGDSLTNGRLFQTFFFNTEY